MQIAKVWPLLGAATLLACHTTGPAATPSRFDGTWRIELDESPLPTQIDAYLLQGDTYQCTTSDPPLSIKADGRDHDVAGDPGCDTASLRVVDDRTTEETRKKGGRTVRTSRMTVSTDGNSATVEWTESGNARGIPVTGIDVVSRRTDAPPGSHAVSGSWRLSRRVKRSENALVITLKLADGVFDFSDPTGQSFAAKLDGTDAPIEGDPSNTVVSVRRVNEDTIEEIDRRDGKVVEVVRFVLSSDGKQMTVDMKSEADQSSREYVLHKQEGGHAFIDPAE